MNFANNEGNYGGGWPPQQNYEEMDFGPYDGFINHNFMGRGGWQGGPSRRGRGGYNNYENRAPPQNYGNWSDDPQFGWGRGFGPNGPPIQKYSGDCPPIRFLLRCGVPRENLKNLPRTFLQLINPAHCGVCNTNLDSFHLSRAHYSSKNHYKKQRNWLSQAPADMGFHHPKNEPPMKSRDLYCELCDVQVTSKVHADSHYAGKPHRAIVEGRKLPKNLALQKKNMSGRLEQLIRRERKFLKPVEKVEKTEDEQKQPELFCQICKTSVTCTEQMTMHLNGKRHLSKEKQHILKMMKGDVSGDGTLDEDAEEGPEDETSKGDPKSQVAEGGDKYDWGNGSAAWDENEVQPAAN